MLVFDAVDEIKGSPFYRPLGGGVEPGEAAVDAVVRELKEEIGAELLRPELLRVEENIFTMDGNPHHEVVFFFTGSLADRSLYEKEKIMVYEDNGQVLTARWRPLDFFDEHHRLVPEVLREMLSDG